MCGIVGLIDAHHDVVERVVTGLEYLEYRGYDSAGIAVQRAGESVFGCVKACGDLAQLRKQLQISPVFGSVAIGHTRWATHGAVSAVNVHPHFDCHGTIALVHNGIIEQHERLRAELESRGHVFKSQTDSEVAAHLLEELLKKEGSVERALGLLVAQLQGAYALLIMLKEFPDRLYFVRKRSPLCLGFGKSKSTVVSDIMAFDSSIDSYAIIPDETYGLIDQDHVLAYTFDGAQKSIQLMRYEHAHIHRDKQGYAHYMLKEIFEQKTVIQRLIASLRVFDDNNLWLELVYPGLDKSRAVERILSIDQFHAIACGTSYHAARMGCCFMRAIARMDEAHASRASELLYQASIGIASKTLFCVLSQSGETADTLEVVRLLRKRDAHVLGVVNVSTSSIAREASACIPMQAGPEIAVASTKSFTSQIIVLYWLALKVAELKEKIDRHAVERGFENMLWCAEILENMLELHQSRLDADAVWFATFAHAIFLGRQESFVLAEEAALKLKELAYIFVEAFPAGELKHGPLALVDTRMLVVLFSSADELVYHKLLSNAQEVKARGGRLVVFAYEGQTELTNLAERSYLFPRLGPHVDHVLGPLCMSATMHYFVYAVARVLGKPIDKPRNLAKSVTVE